jgi:hypothetical protein
MPTQQNKMPQTMLMNSRMTKSKTETHAKTQTNYADALKLTKTKQKLMPKTKAL